MGRSRTGRLGQHPADRAIDEARDRMDWLMQVMLHEFVTEEEMTTQEACHAIRDIILDSLLQDWAYDRDVLDYNHRLLDAYGQSKTQDVLLEILERICAHEGGIVTRRAPETRGDEPMWGPGRQQPRETPRIPEDKPHRSWWYMGYGGNMTKTQMKQRAEELSWRDTRDSYWEGPSDGSEKEDWATTISKHRDSDALEVSNFNVISRDMLSRFPDDVEEHSFRHWAVGWVEHLFVRAFDGQGNITPAFEAIMEWEERLEDYPVADEDDYYETEMEMGEGEYEEY